MIKRNFLVLFALSCSHFALGAAYAQTADNTDSKTAKKEVEEIFVTATRVETAIEKTPIAITAITDKALRDGGIVTAADLDKSAPGLSVNRFGQGLQFTIRGVTSNDLTEKGDPSAAFLLNGVYLARPQATGSAFFDVARVEVLRGPQGTLYGRNATAGVINVITKRPTSDTQGAVNLTYGNYGMINGDMAVGGAVSETLMARFAASYSQQDSYLIDNPASPFKLGKQRKDIAVRGQLLWEPSADFNVLIRADYAYLNGHNFTLVPETNFYNYAGSTPPSLTPTGFVPANITPNRTPGSSKDRRRSDAILPVDPENRNRSYGISAEMNWDIGPATVTYVGSHRRFNRDEDFSTELVFSDTANIVKARSKEDSHELRIATDEREPLFVQVGAYYFRDRNPFANYLYDNAINATPTNPLTVKNILGGKPTFNPNIPADPNNPFAQFVNVPTYPVFLSTYDKSGATNYSFFGQGIWTVTPEVRLTAGMRYSNDTKERTGSVRQQLTFDFNPLTDTFRPVDAKTKFDKLTWRVGLDWDVTPDFLLYGAVATGYKSGGFNDGCLAGSVVNGVTCFQPLTEDQLFYKPETITSYEGGLKGSLFDGSWKFSLAGFHYDYKNLQLLTTVGANAAAGIVALYVNAPSAKINGVELESTVYVADNTRLNFDGAYTKGTFGNYTPSPGVNFKGNSLDHIPNWAFGASVTQRFPLGNGGDISASLGTRWTDDYVLSAYSVGYQVTQPSFFKSDASLTYNAPDDRWYIQGFVKNIEDNVEANFLLGGFGFLPPPFPAGSFGPGSIGIGSPRTFGVRAGAKF